MAESEAIRSTDKAGHHEEFFENGVSKKIDKNSSKVKKRRKYLRDKTAPRPPHSGYIRFLNDRRDQFRAENPNLPFAEITKMLATEWNQLPADKKQHYLLAAEQERVKYVEELAAYKKTDAYRNFIQRKLKKKKINIPIEETRVLEKEKEKEKSSSDNNTVFDFPIFTEEFQRFNKARDCELRYLRKTVTDQDQEVSVLDKHIENMNNGIIKLGSNSEQLKAGCLIYEQYLNSLRHKYLEAFINFTLPDNPEPPTIQTIDQYMINLSTLLKTSTDPNLIASVKRIVCSIDVSQFQN